jgi:hypothetical protein
MFNVFKKTEYVQYSPDLEKLHPNETALIDETAQHIKSLILQNFNKHSHAYRGTHLKTQGIVKGTMTVRDNLSNREKCTTSSCDMPMNPSKSTPIQRRVQGE